MTEKELDSMATVQIKPEYAASEVYSTTSEPPPAYKRQSTSVQIAKIVAFTVIVSSFVIGSFILASAYLQARASCDQMQALDSVLEKELMLETLQQVNKEIPRAEALIGKENEDMDLQNLDRDDAMKKEDQPKEESSGPQNIDNDQSDSSFSDSDEAEELQKTHMKVPLELDLSDLAAALLENNQKSRMNCVVERKHAEELVDSPARTMQLPFGVNLTTDPKKARITGERIAIFCESGSENERRSNEDAEQMRPMFIPIQRIPIPFGAQPQQIPLTHMPQQTMPQQQFIQQMVQQMPPPFQQLPMRPPVPPQFMQAPRAESQYMQAPRMEQQFMQAPRVEQQFMQAPRVEQQQFMQGPRVEQPQVRIQVQRIPVREIHVQQEMPQLPIQIQNSNEMPQIQIQRVPLGVALQRAGITADDLRNIQRMAEERITDELRRLAVEESGSSAESSDNSSDEESDSQSNEQSTPTQQLPQIPQMPVQLQELPEQPPQPQQTLHPPMPEPQILQIGRGAYGRSLPTPVRIPVPMMQSQEMSQESAESERPHYVQPRSIRSTDNVFLQREKRVKRCACDCNC